MGIGLRTRIGAGERCWINKYDHGLSPVEEAELALLQDAMHRYIERVAPLPLDAARSLHQEVLQKAAQAQNARHA